MEFLFNYNTLSDGEKMMFYFRIKKKYLKSTLTFDLRRLSTCNLLLQLVYAAKFCQCFFFQVTSRNKKCKEKD